MKICFKCETEKPLSQFYKHPEMSDGHLNKCKECAKKDAAMYRRANHEYVKKYERRRNVLPHRIEARKEYAKTEEGKASIAKGKKKWLEKNYYKKRATFPINNGIENKKIIKPARCSLCKMSKPRIHGHHWDYSKPLDVFWLCSQCHAFIHSLARNIVI